MPETPLRAFWIDAMAIAYRAYFAFIQRPLINSRGENTSAIYGFATFLNRILENESPDYIAVIFDTPEPTFRHKAYKEYKATREKMPEDMVSQLAPLKELIAAYNIPVVQLPGYEADDIIGTFAKRAEREGVLSYLVTPDKDYFQLVSDKTKILKPARGSNDVELVGFEGVEAKFGVRPEHVIDVLALMGDTSDNIPGVPGIGEKTAIPLIQKYGTVEALLDSAAGIPQKGVREKLLNNRELAMLSKQLVTIDVNVPIDVDFHSLKAREKDKQKLLALFERFEFKSMYVKLRSEGAAPEPAETPSPAAPTPALQPSAAVEAAAPAGVALTINEDKHVYTLIKTKKEFQSLCKRLKAAPAFVFDTETTSVDALRAQVVGISFCLTPREAYYVAVQSTGDDEGSPAGDLFSAAAAPGQGGSEGLPPADVAAALKPIFEDDAKLKIGQNVKYDALALTRIGIDVKGPIFDTMIASYIIRGDGQHNLDALALEYLNYKMVSFSELIGKEKRDIRTVPLEKVCDYSCEDADITMRLYELLQARLEKENMLAICRDVEFPLVGVLTRVEAAGIKIDVPFLESMSKELENMLANLVAEIHRLGGGAFNINSTQQLAEVLFTRLKLPPVRKTKTGYSTDVSVLEELRSQHPIVEKLLDYRQMSKLKSTYIDALPKLINPNTGRVHTSFNQAVAATGRLSSSEPNLQNIPIRTEYGRQIRKAFIAGNPKSLILSADYSQIELRVMAHVSGDDGLRSAFINKEDIHLTTAAKVFGVKPEEVSRDMRRKAKEVNFGIMYGIGAFGLASRLDISQNEAREIIERYFKRFPRVRQYIDDTIAQAHTTGYVSTLLGRRRYIAEINSQNKAVRSGAERQAINMPIQGTSADMIKKAMISIDAAIASSGYKSAMVLQVHDELVFDVPEKEEQPMRTLVHDLMVSALPLVVPIEVEIGVGKNWLDAH